MSKFNAWRPWLAVLILSSFAFLAAEAALPGDIHIRGQVLDASTKTPIPYASVAVYALADSALLTGSTTDLDGFFSIEGLGSSAVFVSIDYIGYDSYTIRLATAPSDGQGHFDLGTIHLAEAATTLAEAVVEGAPITMKSNFDKRVFEVGDNAVTQGATASELLQNIPSISVDVEGNITLRGSGNVNVLVDGRPSALMGNNLSAVLEQLPADAIERVEVITNPSARYDPDGMSGIINIVLKKNQKAGWTGNLNGSIGTRDKYNAGLSLGYRQGAWNLYGNYNFRHENYFRRGDNYRLNNYVDTAFIIDQDINSTSLSVAHLAKVGLDWTPNPKDQVAFSAVYSARERYGPESNDYQVRRLDQSLSGRSLRQSDERSDDHSYDLALNYRRLLNEAGDATWNNDISLSLNQDIEDESYNEDFFDASGLPSGRLSILQNTLGHYDNRVATLQSDLLRPLGKGLRLELGLKSILRRQEADFFSETFDYGSDGYLPDLNLNNRFVYNEQIHSAYGIVAKQWAKLGLQAGLRMEQALTDFELLTTGERFDNDFFNYFPSLTLTYELPAGQKVQASYSRRIERPRAEQLNPFTSFDDPLNLRFGNPRLLPEYTNAYELGYQKYWTSASVLVTAYYRHTSGEITRFRTLEDNGVAVTTFVNLNNEITSGFEGIFNATPTRWLALTLSYNAFYLAVDGGNLQNNLSSEAFSWQASINGNIKLSKTLDFQINGQYLGPYVFAQGDLEPIYAIDAALRWAFLKRRATLSLRLSDVFDTRDFAFNSRGDNFDQQSYRKRESQIGFLSLSYRLGGENKTERGERDRTEGGGIPEVD